MSSLSASEPGSPLPLSCNARSPRTQRVFSTMRDPRDGVNGHRPVKTAGRSTISSTPLVSFPRPATVSGRRSTRTTDSRNDRVSETSDTTAASAVPGETPLGSYTGPTPKSLDGVRTAFFETKGFSLESIAEWESHCLHADTEVLATAMQNKRIAGTLTGYDEADGFKGTATTRGTLNLWLLSQAKFNGLKVLALWARLG